MNRGSGSRNSEQSREDEIRSGFNILGLDPDIRAVEGSELKNEVLSAKKTNPDVIVAAGGDGTVNTVASGLVNSELPLGVLPMGTLNHFAKDLNIPVELSEAILNIYQNHTVPVDIGKVNGRYFVNNSSIGVYPWVVRERDSGWARSYLGKWFAMAYAWGSCMRHFPLSRVRITLDDEDRFDLKTPFIFVGNNKYHVRPSGFGNRNSLNTGILSVFTSRHDGRLGLIRLAFRALTARIHRDTSFGMYLVSKVRIESPVKSISVALDGEVTTLESPLDYSIEPSALRVIVPKI